MSVRDAFGQKAYPITLLGSPQVNDHAPSKTALSRKRVNSLIKDIQRNPFTGIGDPEPLKYNWSGFWSRRITKEHRLVYAVEKESILIAQCRFHY